MVLSSGAVCDVHGGAPPTRVLSTCCGGAVCGAGGAPPTRTTRWADAAARMASHAAPVTIFSAVLRLPPCARRRRAADFGRVCSPQKSISSRLLHPQGSNRHWSNHQKALQHLPATRATGACAACAALLPCCLRLPETWPATWRSRRPSRRLHLRRLPRATVPRRAASRKLI